MKTNRHNRISFLTRRPPPLRKVTTVSDLLTQDDVKTTLDKTVKDQAEITDLICIYQDREGFINFHITKDTTLDRQILLLEQVKMWLLTGEDE